MNTPKIAPEIPLSIVSDASAWLVRLSGPLKTAATEEGFQNWLKEDSRHGAAFRQVSAEWDEADGLKRFTDVMIQAPGLRAEAQPHIRRTSSRRKMAALAAAIAMLLIGGIYFQYMRVPGINTGINELRVIMLEDGSRIHLNTRTRVSVAYDEAERRVRLESGEALFEVAKQPLRPFIVEAGDRAVKALGTTFLVRRQAEQLSVTLVEGKVEVSTAGAGANVAVAQDSPVAPITLAPGQRLVLAKQVAPQLDRPQVSQLLAWQQGKVVIDSLPLATAIAEMNRYSQVPLVLAESQPDDLLVSGVFTAGQSLSFARAMAQSYGLRVVEHGESIELAGVGRSALSPMSAPPN
ncbi:FecR family protein [Steroidobacter sp.]|uniref:FecR family protein n=1 Tax=Steroidobacter sp. TaxID=1978227 RepID=UPI001A5578DC|nr:FecR domain-containing protein [Steroidobacter sp.]MBL8265673.1 FecR domain-containing protein [Steroidobacter sp.]